MKNTFQPLHYTNEKRSYCSVKPQWFLQLNRKLLSFLHKIIQLQPRQQYFQLVFCHFQLAILAGSALKDLTQVHQVASLPSTVAFSGFNTHALLKNKSLSCIHQYFDQWFWPLSMQWVCINQLYWIFNRGNAVYRIIFITGFWRKSQI